MRRAISAWWSYGQTRWGWRDYLRHFGLVSAVTFTCTMHAVSIMRSLL